MWLQKRELQGLDEALEEHRAGSSPTLALPSPGQQGRSMAGLAPKPHKIYP